MEYFAEVKTVQGAKKRYHALAKKWHPDRNGSIGAGAVMADINRQYKEALVALESERFYRDAAKSRKRQEMEPEVHVTDTEADVAPKHGPKKQPFEDPQPPRKRGALAKSFVRSLVSDRDVQLLGDAAGELISNTAKVMISKGISAFQRWKMAD